MCEGVLEVNSFICSGWAAELLLARLQMQLRRGNKLRFQPTRLWSIINRFTFFLSPLTTCCLLSVPWWLPAVFKAPGLIITDHVLASGQSKSSSGPHEVLKLSESSLRWTHDVSHWVIIYGTKTETKHKSGVWETKWTLTASTGT